MTRAGVPIGKAGASGVARGCVLVPVDARAGAGPLWAVQAYNLVGRAPECQFRFDSKYVSMTHSCLRWTGEAWRLQDLGSTNGTFCNGRRLQRAEQVTLSVGDSVAFGGKRTYRVSSVGQPAAVAEALLGGARQFEKNGMIALPSSRRPEVMLLATENGWVVETANDRGPLSDGQLVQTSAGPWRFRCPRVTHPTEPLTTAAPSKNLESLQLCFRVSRDEEHVDLVVTGPSDTRSFRSRACFYLLLTLARLRVRDHAADLPSAAAGWVAVEDVQRMLGTTEQQLNIDIYRLRKLFSTCGVVDAVDVVERRSRPGKLRIGVERLLIERT